jgi:hypothetical protein
MPKSPSTKRLQIDKANTKIVIMLAIASFVTVFSLISSQALLSKRAYQSRVIKEKNIAKIQLEQNVQAVNSLADSYRSFVDTPTNFLGGSSTGEGPRSGDNARLILDALPSQYDFPALASSIEKILTDNSFKIEGISGTDDELTNGGDRIQSDQAIEMPFAMSVEGNYTSIQNLFKLFERSIRPFEIKTISLTGTDASMRVKIDATTYYQPGKKLEIKLKDVK